MKRAYHIPKNTGQAARKKCRKAIYAKEEFAEFKDWMKSEVKFVLKKKWWMVGSVDHLPLHLRSLIRIVFWTHISTCL